MTRQLPNPTLTNPWNQLLNERRNDLGYAQRFALTPDCNPISGDSKVTPAQSRAQLIEVPINATAAGDNLIIQTLSGRKLIYEIFLWNAGAGAINIGLYQGPSASGILKLPISNFPGTTGVTFGFNGNFEQPHFTIDNGQPFVLNCSAAGPVQGMMRYKIDNGTD